MSRKRKTPGPAEASRHEEAWHNAVQLYFKARRSGHASDYLNAADAYDVAADAADERNWTHNATKLRQSAQECRIVANDPYILDYINARKAGMYSTSISTMIPRAQKRKQKAIDRASAWTVGLSR